MRIDVTVKGKLLRCPSIFPGCEVSVRCIQGQEFPKFSDNSIGLYLVFSDGSGEQRCNVGDHVELALKVFESESGYRYTLFQMAYVITGGTRYEGGK